MIAKIWSAPPRRRAATPKRRRAGLSCSAITAAAKRIWRRRLPTSQQERGTQVVFVTAPDLLDYLRVTFSPSSGSSFDRRFQIVRNTPLLVLDDLSTESATAWAKEKLFQLLNHRYVAAAHRDHLVLDDRENRRTHPHSADGSAALYDSSPSQRRLIRAGLSANNIVRHVLNALTVTPYQRRHRHAVRDLLFRTYRIHTHLDWQETDQWLDEGERYPARLAWQKSRLQGIIATSAPLNHTCWLRIACVSDHADAQQILTLLWDDLLPELRAQGVNTVALLMIRNWIATYATRARLPVHRRDHHLPPPADWRFPTEPPPAGLTHSADPARRPVRDPRRG